MVELSTAVYTKDHELQRSDNLIVSKQAKCIFVKVSPNDKESAGGMHGGDTNFPYQEPYALFLKQHKVISFHVNWETKHDDKTILEKNENYLSIPADASAWKEILDEVLNYAHQTNLQADYWVQDFTESLNKPNLIKWKQELLSHNPHEDVKEFNSDRTKWVSNCPTHDRDYLEVKLRMGHAMDPSRALLSYYSFFHSNRNKVLSGFHFDLSTNGWYRGVSQAQNIEKIIGNKTRLTQYDAAQCLFIGLNFPSNEMLLSKIRGSSNNKIDISDYVLSNYHDFNISIKTLIKYSFATRVYGRGLDFCLIFGDQVPKDKDTLLTQPNLDRFEKINEDLVTFYFLHQTCFFHDKTVISVSYPGSQADIVILPEINLGRRQERITVDIISYDDENIYLCESKDSIKKINKDIQKLSRFRKEQQAISAIDLLLSRFGHQKKHIKLVICFSCETEQCFNDEFGELDLSNIDYSCVFIKSSQTYRIYKKRKLIKSSKFLQEHIYTVAKNTRQ